MNEMKAPNRFLHRIVAGLVPGQIYEVSSNTLKNTVKPIMADRNAISNPRSSSPLLIAWVATIITCRAGRACCIATVAPAPALEGRSGLVFELLPVTFPSDDLRAPAASP